MKKKRWIIAIIIFFFIVGVINQDDEPISSESVPEKQETSKVVEPVSEPIIETVMEPEKVEVNETFPEEISAVSFDEIYKAFKSNKLAAEEKYNGNRYGITAKINGMSTSGLANLTGGATLTMEYKVDNTIVFFLAEFEKEQEGELKKIVVGDVITFTGECWSGRFGKCELK